jgi:hypothetical protein
LKNQEEKKNVKCRCIEEKESKCCVREKKSKCPKKNFQSVKRGGGGVFKYGISGVRKKKELEGKF